MSNYKKVEYAAAMRVLQEAVSDDGLYLGITPRQKHRQKHRESRSHLDYRRNCKTDDMREIQCANPDPYDYDYASADLIRELQDWHGPYGDSAYGYLE